MNFALVGIIVGAYVLLSVLATRFVIRDAYSKRGQKVIQLALVWLLPAIGALVVLAVHRKEEKPSGRYRNDLEVGDDFGASRNGTRKMTDVLDDD